MLILIPVLDLIINDIAFGGEGVARYEGVVVFVPFVMQGEKVRITIEKKMRHFWRAKLVEVLEPSPHRIAPPCPYFSRCGGCQYQQMTYAEQLRVKEEQVRQLLQRIGKIHAHPFLPTIGSPEGYGYRNRIVVHSDGRVVGFRGYDNKTLVDIEHCEIASEEVNQKLITLRATPASPGHYSLRESALPQTGFYQTNRYLLDAFRQTVKQAMPTQGKFLFEGYCGNGFFTAVVANYFEKVVAVETNSDALSLAPSLPQVQWLCNSVETVLAKENPDVLLLDPPREGLSKKVIDLILQKKSVQHFIYISCNPATFARDLAKLSSRFVLCTIQLVDLFPQTAHIELVAVLKS
ncbi:MAG: TRAM domain-containing protein [Verrucomicrobiae bacterium]|nr:TRAM domain-containing protein [Verrucomicrobiae bacterium]